MAKHIKIIVLLSILTTVLIVLSYFSYFECISGILLGISTGIIAGIILQLVTAIKSKEQYKLNKLYEAIHNINISLLAILHSYPILYSNFMKTSKEQIEYRKFVIEDIYNLYKNTLDKLVESLAILEEDNIIDKPPEFISAYPNLLAYKDCLNNILNQMYNIIFNSSDYNNTDNSFSMFDNAYNFTHDIYSKFILIETNIYNKKKQIDNSIF